MKTVDAVRTLQRSFLLAVTVSQSFVSSQLTVNLDRFTFDIASKTRPDGFTDYAPQDWLKIDCEDANDCPEAYRDKWEYGRGWSLGNNACLHCPEGTFQCGRHHQSPINLKREYGLELGTHPNANECIDLHWMKYEDSFCTFDQLEDAEAFTIERHALRISQPIETYDNIEDDTDGVPDGVRLMCRIPGRGSRFGRIDFSKGFSDWWHLSHTDIRVPSEHTQEGRRYDAEIQLAHFYSIPWWNEMATVSIFLDGSSPNNPVYRYLDKVICQWRRYEFQVRQECGLEPVEGSYPGCFPLSRRDRERNRNLRRSSSTEEEIAVESKKRRFQNVADVILHNEKHRSNPNHTDVKIFLDKGDTEPSEDKDWDAWIQQQSEQMDKEDALYHDLKDRTFNGNHTDEALHEKFRKLLQGDEIPWFTYWPMLGVRTEYYFRYEGTQTIPPCHGKWIQGSRRNTNHWRVMKDPIRIHPRQLKELQRLMADRIAPKGSAVNECQPDTAAKVTRDPSNPRKILEVDGARPIMYTSHPHFKTFCECKDWPSKWPEDRKWCEMNDENQRFYDQPYNFETDGF
ncbi:Eukaryotic-type carbonic anhydrase [Nitzschia inconspicua]|uniref:Eukaryotic-type carbonic anhydrase n=1 Tax=Nitzschia inconspicua TaxID=303405 RepID=A0A9K3M240_9STRA|nr:Eukaryotic-type carbonic anhydrase [Nitzschia inconspicua]